MIKKGRAFLYDYYNMGVDFCTTIMLVGSFRIQTCPINLLVYRYTKSPGGHREGDFRGGSGEGLFFYAEK